MEIVEWLKKENLSLHALGNLAGIKPVSLYAAFSKERGLSRRLATRLSEATKGEVTVEEAMKASSYKFEDSRKKLRVTRCEHCGK